jgi:hypothetical protein
MNWQRIIGPLFLGLGLLALALNLHWIRVPASLTSPPAPAAQAATGQNSAVGPKPATTPAAAGQTPPAPPALAGRKTPSTPAADAGKKTAAPPTAASQKALSPPAVKFEPLQNRLLEQGRRYAGQVLRYLETGKAYKSPAVLAPLALGLILLVWSFKRKRNVAALLPGQPEAASPPTPVQMKSAGRAPKRWHSCNVLQVGADAGQLWQFDVRGDRFTLDRQQTTTAGKPIPSYLVGKTWRSLWQRKLNVAWLPAEHVFLRVARFPQSSFDETLAMVELQLEKFSPLPVTQIVWTMHVMPQPAGNLQTVVIIIAARSLVEEFLGQLEGQGYLADRLELPVLDQLQGTAIAGDGAWIYPDRGSANARALVAWWYGGSLQQLDLVNLSAGTDRAASLREQITHVAWSGELDGWLTTPPRWHLVADPTTAAEWEPLLSQGLAESVEVIAPLPPPELAAATAQRAARAAPNASLLPVEYSVRYQQQFVDRLWMRGLGAVLALYVVGVLVYLVALEFLLFHKRGVDSQVAALSQSYTNAMQLKARYQVLSDRQELKYAALDCWNITAALLPEALTLEVLDFRDGKKLTLNGTAPADQVNMLLDFNEAMRKATSKDNPLFRKFGDLQYNKAAGGGTVSWNFSCELNRVEAQ